MAQLEDTTAADVAVVPGQERADGTIKVIIDTEGPTDIEALPEAAREMLFDRLGDENPDLHKLTLMAFADMVALSAAERFRADMPTINELLLRKVVLLSRGFGTKFNTVIIPIRPDFAPGRARFGAAADTSAYHVKVRFDYSVLTVTPKGLYYIVAPNDEFTVMGITVSPICAPAEPLPVHVYDKTVGPQLLMGNYSSCEASAACDSYYAHPDYARAVKEWRSIGPTATEAGPTTTIMFTPENIGRALIAMFEYLATYEQYHPSVDAAAYVWAQLRRALGDKPLHDQLGGALSVATRPVVAPPISATKTRPMKPVVDQLNRDALAALETLHAGRFSEIYPSAIIADIYMRGFADIYFASPQRRAEMIEKYKNERARVEFLAKSRAERQAEQVKLSKYMAIIEKKLGQVRAAELRRKIDPIRARLSISAADVLELLPAADRKPIQAEFVAHEKYIEAVINNKCPHVPIYRRMRRAKDDETTRAALSSLRRFFKKHDADHMIQCNNCGFDIMCPHMLGQIEAEIAQKDYAIIKAQLQRYIAPAAARDRYFCKVCGEVISMIDVYESTGPPPTSVMSEELRTFIWGEVAGVIKYIKFDGIANIPKMITVARDTVYPYVFEIEKQILKSKTGSADELKAKRRLFVTIYVFAWLIHIMAQRGANMSFRNFKSTGKNLLVDLIKHALSIIIMTRNVVIRDIPGMTADLIKNRLIEAYKSIGAVTLDAAAAADVPEDIAAILMLDPAYHYYYSMYVISNNLSGGSRHVSSPLKAMPQVLGKTMREMEKAEDIFGSAPGLRAGWEKVAAAFDKLGPLTAAEVATCWQIYSAARVGCALRSFDKFAARMKTRLYLEQVYIDKSAAEAEFTNVVLREKLAVHIEGMAGLLAQEQVMDRYRRMAGTKNYCTFPGPTGSYRAIHLGHISLGRVLDEDGQPHQWGIYIVADGAEITARDINADLAAGKQTVITIHDRKCTVCGVLRSQCDGLDEIKIHESLDLLSTVNNFFRFYENRCPVGGMHEWVGDKCKKCSIGREMIAEPTAKTSMNYFRQYRAAYMAERGTMVKAAPATVYVGPPDSADYAAEYAKWVANFNIILDLANKLKINQRLILAIGAVEGQEYADVLSGAYIPPPEPEHRSDTRIFILDSYIVRLITEYNQMRYYQHMMRPPADLSQLIDASGIPKHKLADLPKQLDDIVDDYHRRFAYIQHNKKPREIIEWCLQRLCEMCLRIWAAPGDETEKLRHDFVALYMSKVIRAEELLSKPGHFNWSLVFGDTMHDKEEMDPNRADPDAVAEPDRRDALPLDDDVETDIGDTAAAFSTADLDVDDADADPGDTDEIDNDIRVEGFGLD